MSRGNARIELDLPLAPHILKNTSTKGNDARLDLAKGGDARIEHATSCTLSKNHTTRPITLGD